MKEFVMIFRSEVLPEVKFNPEGVAEISEQWETWMGGIAAQNKLAATGNRLGMEGATVRPNNVVTNGPYAEIKEMISGYIIVKAENIEEAAEIAKSCPILEFGGNVEVRDVVVMNLSK